MNVFSKTIQAAMKEQKVFTIDHVKPLIVSLNQTASVPDRPGNDMNICSPKCIIILNAACAAL